MTTPTKGLGFSQDYIESVRAELERRGWAPDSRGEPDCCDEACAAGADIIRQRHDTIVRLTSRLAAAEADAELQCGCEWDDAGELDAACMKHWKYFWQLHGPHCTAKSPQNFTAGTDPAIWNIADAARSEGKKP